MGGVKGRSGFAAGKSLRPGVLVRQTLASRTLGLRCS